jgi:hypothetical protein
MYAVSFLTRWFARERNRNAPAKPKPKLIVAQVLPPPTPVKPPERKLQFANPVRWHF